MLTRHSPARPLVPTCYLLAAVLAALLVLSLAAPLSDLKCACTPITCFLLLCGIFCTARVDSHSGSSLVRGRWLSDWRGSGVFWPSDPDVMCCGVRVPRCRYLLGSRNMAAFISADTSLLFCAVV